jgi:hypothetical protein
MAGYRALWSNSNYWSIDPTTHKAPAHFTTKLLDVGRQVSHRFNGRLQSRWRVHGAKGVSVGVDCGDIHAGAVGEVSSRGMGREGERVVRERRRGG